MLSQEQRRWLLRIARHSIEAVLEGERPRIDPSALDEVLTRPSGAFVSLHTKDGDLRGCIGSLEATRPLWRDVVHNARAAAFEDPRFPPMAVDDLADLGVKVSVLSATEPLPGGRDQLVEALRPGVDGVLIEAGERRGTFLPSVWESVSSADAFLAALAVKAGLPDGQWPAGVRAARYTTDEFGD